MKLPNDREFTSPTAKALRVAAYHEAGHVVMALLLGGTVEFASIAEADAKVPERPGVSRYDFDRRFAGREETLALREERMEVETLAYLAGPRAAILAKCEGNYLDKTLQEHRLSAIMDILEFWRPDDFPWDEMHAYLDEMDLKVTELLQANWPNVKAVAQGLLEQSKLDGIGIEKLLAAG